MPFGGVHFDATESRIARPVVLQGEPEDSVYRLAREILNRGDYGRAAQMFKEIAQKYPKSVYSSDLPYYEAWSRYRIGTTEELRAAVKLLEPRASKLTGNVTRVRLHGLRWASRWRSERR